MKLILMLLSAIVLSSCVHAVKEKPELQYTTDWVSALSGHWKLILADFKDQPDIHYLEVGVYEGRSVFWIFDNILTHPTTTATLIDPFWEPYDKVFFDNLSKHPSKKQVIVKKGYSKYELRKLPLNSYDIIYIDGSHMAKDVYMDAALSWELLKTNGILIFDNYDGRRGKYPLNCRPESPLDGFLMAFGDDIEIIDMGGRQVIIRKLKPIVGAPNYISRLGEYYFSWRTRTVFHIDTNKEYKGLSKKEIDTLASYLLTQRKGELKGSISRLPKDQRDLTFLCTKIKYCVQK